LTGELTEDASISLNWASVSASDAYLIYRSSSKDPVFRVIASSETAMYKDTAVEKGVTYQYKVSAINAGGESPLSNVVEVFTFDSTQPLPPVPSELNVVETKSITVKLDWIPVDDAISYSIFRATEQNGTYEKIGSTSTAEYTDSTVIPSSTYYYKVTTTGIGGESEKSASVTTTTKSPVTLPEVPTGLASGKVTTSTFEINWNSVLGAESYNIYRKANGDSGFTKIDNTASAIYIDDSISVGKTGYTYKISALNEMGETEQSNELTVTMPVPSTPSDLTVGLANGEVEYLGYAKVNTYYDRTAEPGVEYTYYIKAQNASGESEMSNKVKVIPGLITVLENYMKQYEATGDMTAPSIAQLSNTLKQTKHHLEKGSHEKVVTFLEKYVEQLDRNAKQHHISSEAKMLLSYYAQRLIDNMEKRS
jgi:fibronectin type 3 domain-containing protein